MIMGLQSIVQQPHIMIQSMMTAMAAGGLIPAEAAAGMLQNTTAASPSGTPLQPSLTNADATPNADGRVTESSSMWADTNDAEQNQDADGL